MQRLGLAHTNELTLAVLMSLAFDFSADAEVFLDQWFGVQVTTPCKPSGLFVACDDPADGLVYLWTELVAEFPDRVATRGGGTAADVETAARWSAERVAVLQDLDVAKAAHQAEHGNKYDNSCATCRTHIERFVENQVALDRAWGSSVLDAAVERECDR